MIISKRTSLLWPYVLWECINAIIFPFVSQYTYGGSKEFIFAEFLKKLCLGQASWFLWTLFIVQTLGIIVRKLKKELVLFIFVCTYMIEYLYPNLVPKNLQKIFENMPFFVLGAFWYSEFSELISSFLKKTVLYKNGVFVSALFLLVTLVFFEINFNTYNINFIINPIKAIIGIIMIVALSVIVDKIKVGNAFEKIGVASLAVFLLHMYPQGAFRYIWAKIFGIESVISSVIVQTLFAVLLPTVFYYVVKRLNLAVLFQWPVKK